MKKILTSLAILATAFTVSSCLDLLKGTLDVLTEDPMFVLSGEFVDGQTFKSELIKSYAYSFSAKPAACVTFGKQDKPNKNIEMTFNYTATNGKAQEVEVTAQCNDAEYIAQIKEEKDKDIEPVTNKITIVPWKICVHEVLSDGSREEVLPTGKNIFQIKAGKTYVFQMTQAVLSHRDANDHEGYYKPITKILYGSNEKFQDQEFQANWTLPAQWEVTADGNLNPSKTFGHQTAPSGTFRVAVGDKAFVGTVNVL